MNKDEIESPLTSMEKESNISFEELKAKDMMKEPVETSVGTQKLLDEIEAAYTAMEKEFNISLKEVKAEDMMEEPEETPVGKQKLQDEIEAALTDIKETTKRMADDIEVKIQELNVEIQELKVKLEILSPSSHDEIQELKSEIQELEGLKATYEESKAGLEESSVETQTVLDEDYTYETLNASSTSRTILNMVGAGALWVGKKTWASVEKGSKYVWDNKEELYEKGLEKKEELYEKSLEKKEEMEKKAVQIRDSAFEQVKNQNEETVLRNYERLKRDHKAGETLSTADRLYIKAAREKLNL